MDVGKLIETMAAFGYPEDLDIRRSAVWCPFLPKPSYEDDEISSCRSFLIHKEGLPRVLICPTEMNEQYFGLAMDKSIFSQPPPYFINYDGGHMYASQLVGGGYLDRQTLPTWGDLDDSLPGCLCDQRADKEVRAVRERITRWLQDSYSRATVEALMRIHAQQASLVKELIQNACDCFASEVQFTWEGDTLVFRHNGHPFMPTNVHAISAINISCKPPGAIGYKGIGFKAVFQVCRRPQVSSGPFRFAFEPSPEYRDAAAKGILCPYLPVVDNTISHTQDGWTEFRFPLQEGKRESIEKAFREQDGTLLLFVAGRGLRLRKIVMPDLQLELHDEEIPKSGVISLARNGTPRYWFLAKHEFKIDEDRESAVVDFRNRTGRQELKIPLEEEILIAVPLSKTEDETLVPDSDNHGRFHSYLPTREVYQYPWHINANFLVDEQRDHLIEPIKGSWNATLLDECGKALLGFLDEIRSAYERDPGFPVTAYYNTIPNWDEVLDTSQIGSHFELMKESFYRCFAEKSRVPVHKDVDLEFALPNQTVWIDRQLLPAFSLDVWAHFLPPGSSAVHCELDEEVWRSFLCEACSVAIFSGHSLVERLAEKNWPSMASVKTRSPDIIRLIGRLCCYLGMCGIDGDDVGTAWILLDSNRTLHRSNDMPYGQKMYRLPEEELIALPEYVSKQISIVHDGVRRFLQRDTSYFKGVLSENLTGELITSGGKFWSGLVEALELETVIVEWLNPTFSADHDGDEKIVARRFEWLRFLLRNRDRLKRKALYWQLDIRLLARLESQEVWKPPEEVWLFSDCPQGRDVELFIGNTPGVALLSKKYTDLLRKSDDIDESALGEFLSRLGVQCCIEENKVHIGSFESWDKQGFCETLDIDLEQMPSANINYPMSASDYDLSEDIKSALNDAIADSNHLRRLDRLRVFARLLEKAWPDIKKKKAQTKVGTYHPTGAWQDSELPGGPSQLARRIRETAWVPLANKPSILKRPSETCLLTGITGALISDSASIGNLAGIPFEDQDLIQFAGFTDAPQELTSLDAIRVLAQKWSEYENPTKEFEQLYHRLHSELGSTVDLEQARRAFLEEKLLFVPTKPPVLRRSDEALCEANTPFDGFLEDLADFYPREVHELFRKMGVASKVEDTHYLRYLVRYVWEEQPPINERRRTRILQCYRQLVKWAKDIPSEQGVWDSPDGRRFSDSLLFYGSCSGERGWYSGHDKKIVFRDDPQKEELLVDSDEYVLESFLSQLRSTEEGYEPFLSMFNVKRASQLVTRQVRPISSAMRPLESSNLRQNLFHLTDLLGPRLNQKVGEEIRHDAQKVFFDKAEDMRNHTVAAELHQCNAIVVVFREKMTGQENLVTSDAALDIGDGYIKLYIAAANCEGVSAQLARELKEFLRTATLSEQIMLPVDRILEDVAGSLDKPPDQFENRLQVVLNRHYPALVISTHMPIDSDIKGILVGTEATLGLPSGDGNDLTTQPPPVIEPITGPIMPSIEDQTAEVVKRPPEDYKPFGDELKVAPTGDRRRSRRARTLTEEQRREVGRRAEIHVFKKEVERLKEAGRHDLAEKVVDRNEPEYDPYGPYDIDSFDQDETGQWVPIMIEVKGHLDPSAYWFDMSEPEFRMATADSSTAYFVYLVLNLKENKAHIEPLDFRKLWREKCLHCTYRTLRIGMQLSEGEDS